jgi:hypothetical protein
MGKFVAGHNPHAIQTIKVGGSIMGAPAYWMATYFISRAMTFSRTLLFTEAG